MTTKFTHLVTHWEPDEALSVIAFLDEVKDLLWTTYGEEIIASQEDELNHSRKGVQLNLNFDDRIPF